MTADSFHPSRWLVVDDSREDADTHMQAIADLDGQGEWANDLKAAESLLRKKNFDVVVLDYILRSSRRTGDELLPSLRRALPHLPVVMVSSSDAPDLPMKALSAGADVFLPKTSMGLALSRQLLAAARSAAASRRMRIKEDSNWTPPRDLYVWSEARESIDATLTRKNERLLIVGGTGDGKTSLASKIARDFLVARYGHAARPIVHLNFESMDPTSIEAELFGEREQTQERVQLTAFERALGGVIVLDGLESLTPALQRGFKAFCDTLDFGNRPFEDTVKIIATVRTDALEAAEPGLVEVFAHRELHIPTLASFPDKSALVDVLCQNLGITVADSAHEKLLSALEFCSWAKSIRAARRNLGLAGARARAAGRAAIFPDDLEGLGALVEESKPSAGKAVTLDASSLPIAELVAMIRGCETRYEDAREVLKDVMIRNALEQFDGNKKKVAEVLGVSRQTIYEIVGR